MTTPIERFCWVKTVRLDRTDTTGALRAERLAEVLRLPGIKAPPPPDGKFPTPHECAGIPKGGNTNPPSRLHFRPMPEANSKGDTRHWCAVSYAPGADITAEEPVLALAFQPVAGDRCAAVTWRLENPEWFSDAFAVSLLSQEA